jgi:hypothetical protein
MSDKCTFCGRGQDEVFTFFRPLEELKTAAGVPICICDRCIESCWKHLSTKRDYAIERLEKQVFRELLDESVTETLIRAIVDMKYRDALLEAFSERAELAKVDLSDPPQRAALQKLPAAFVCENRVLPWRIEGDHLVVAFYNPLHLLDVYDEIVRTAGMAIRPALLARDELLRAIERYVGASR